MSPDSNFRQRSRYELRLLGPVQLTDRDGRDLTPRGRKTQALLAILSTAQGAPMTRAALQDLLWSDRMPAQGRDSLRQAIRELRAAFADEADEVLVIDGDRVRLEQGFFLTDISGQLPSVSLGPAPEFLAGCDVRDPEFENWLREARSHLSGRLPATDVPKQTAPLQHGKVTAAEPAEPSWLRLAFQTPDAMSNDPVARFAATLLAERLQRHFLDQGLCLIVMPSAVDPQPDADAAVSIASVRSGNEITLAITLRASLGNRLLASHELSIEANALTSTAFRWRAAQLTDQITQRLIENKEIEASSRFRPSRLLASGIDRMFRLSRESIALAHDDFVKANEIEQTGVSQAWLAYLRAFEFEKSFRERRGEGWDNYRDLAARAMELEPHNPSVAALLAHVHGFVGRDFNRAFQLLEPFEDSATDNLMLQDSLAMFRFYTGRIELAEEHAMRAAQLGRSNRHRYFFTASVAMIALVQGRFADAIRHGEACIAQHPDPRGPFFEPALRTLMAAYAHAGDPGNARRVLGLIHRQDPAFTLESLADQANAPIRNATMLDLVRTAMSKIGGE